MIGLLYHVMDYAKTSLSALSFLYNWLDLKVLIDAHYQEWLLDLTIQSRSGESLQACSPT